jgi:prepilin signal peptidase PulO-like enzyme (type II secretory pathway)
MNAILAVPLVLRLVALFVAGLVAGSLANLGIYRLGWNRRAISPWSRPPAGAPPRQWWDRLPVVGWLGLRREEAVHGRGFWVRPMLLELAGGVLFAFLYGWEIAAAGLLPPDFPRPLGRDMLGILHHGYIAHVVLLLAMWVASWIDIDEKTIPDTVTVPGTLAALALMVVWPASLLPDVRAEAGRGFFVSFVTLTSPNDLEPWRHAAWTGLPALALGLGCWWLWCVALLPRSWYPRHGYRRAWQLLLARLVRQRTSGLILAMGLAGSAVIAGVWKWGGAIHWCALLSSLAGLAIGGGIVWIVRVLGSSVLGREAMGFGDVTLMAMIGAMLGWQAAVIVFFLAPLMGIVVGLTAWAVRGQSEIPYGPFLCLAAMTTIVGWAALWQHFQGAFALGWWLLAVLAACLAMIVVLLPLVRLLLSLLRRA